MTARAVRAVTEPAHVRVVRDILHQACQRLSNLGRRRGLG